ncbi:hypothetical protein [Halotalea alkalilenta]|uniref:hypothetical protein n=1 Tax=Halotalea alkalilenta TaxID=376489 RepID=UPI00069444E2|nr:hypothetical protein [Halotalea alkalilenta]
MQRSLSLALLCASFSLLAGCQGLLPSEAPGTQRAPFPEAEYAKLARSGSSTIAGQVSVDLGQGRVVPGAGVDVLAAPVTSYSREAYEALRAGRPIAPADPRAQEYTRRTLADDHGNFRFEHLAAGSYYLISRLEWSTEENGQQRHHRQPVQREVKVGEGAVSNVMLSP